MESSTVAMALGAIGAISGLTAAIIAVRAYNRVKQIGTPKKSGPAFLDF